MRNIGLFFVTVAVYFGVWALLGGMPENVEGYALRLGVLALLAMPFNIKGNVWTIAGNAEGRNVYSLFSVYQKARNNAASVFGALYQRAGEEACTFVGFTGYQCARYAGTFIGLTAYQQGGERAETVFSMAFYQTVPGSRECSFAVFSTLTK